MRSSQYSISTLKEIPSDAEIMSHQLLLRGGFIRQIAAGLYTWLPIGYRVLRKVEQIVREEMDAIGALELMLPIIQPAELWRESGRWDKYDEGQLLKFQDRHNRDFCFGPTHEEVITAIARNELKSHKQLPVTYYQIQIKFRDETRPRFGIMRAREFLMKDAYSFHIDQESLDETFNQMHQAYSRILERMHLNFRPVQADSGAIGGDKSVEFHVLAESGESLIAFSTGSNYAANIELAEARPPAASVETPAPLSSIETPDVHTIADLAKFLNISADRTVKTLIVKGAEVPFVALVLRGDHQLNAFKAEKLDAVLAPLTFASDEEIFKATETGAGSIGPVNLNIPIIADRSAAALHNFVCGANRDGEHIKNVNWERDCPGIPVADIRDVVAGDPSPDGKGTLQMTRGIEVGHIFQLGDVYSKAMKATVLDDQGKASPMLMGCYGIGVSRLVAALIEQNHDDKGIVWPDIVAPFNVIMIPINAHKSEEVRSVTEDLYQTLLQAGFEVLLDDRESHRPGAKFADAELMGIPHRLVIGERSLADGKVEYTNRRTGFSTLISTEDVLDHISHVVEV